MKKLIIISIISLSCIATPKNELQTVRIGVIKNDPPFSTVDHNHFSGFEIELTKEIFTIRLNMNIVYVPLEKHELLTKLAAGTIDVAASSKIGITRALQSTFSFVQTNGATKKKLSLVLYKRSVEHLDPQTVLSELINQEHDICFFGASELTYQSLIRAGVPRKHIQLLSCTEFKTMSDYVNGFKEAHYDVLFVGDSIFAQFLEKHPDGEDITHLDDVCLDPLCEILGYGYAFNPSSPLIKKVQAAVNGMIADGTLALFIKKTNVPYSFPDMIELKVPRPLSQAGLIAAPAPLDNSISSYIDAKHCAKPEISISPY